MEALGDPIARRLLFELAQEERDAHALVVRTGLPQSSVYRKLRELEAAKLIHTTRFAFTSEGKKVEVYRSWLREVRVVVQRSGIQVLVAFAEPGSDRLGAMWKSVRHRGR